MARRSDNATCAALHPAGADRGAIVRILIAYDGSAGSEQSLTLADSVDWPAHSSLRVAAVIEPMMPFVGSRMTGGFDIPSPEVDAEITAYQQEQVTKAADKLRSGGRTVEGVVLRGRPATALVDEATRSGADLVIVGSRGHGRIARLLLGSVSAEVVDHARCPVLVSRTASIERVILAADGSGPSAAAESVIATWPIFEHLPIQVVSVADVVEPWHTGIAPTMYHEAIEAHAKDLAEARANHARIAAETTARLRGVGRQAESVVRTGDAAAEIISAAADVAADLVVMGSRGRTGFTRVVLGSVARNVLHGSTASVLVVHDPGASDGGEVEGPST
jgi:nucleotide-binding universal stress UspA family protein